MRGFDWAGYNGLGKGTVTADEREQKISIGGVKYPLGLGMHPYEKSSSQVKFLLKGILASEDARRAADAGIDAIIVSNHGGRVEDGGLSRI